MNLMVKKRQEIELFNFKIYIQGVKIEQLPVLPSLPLGVNILVPQSKPNLFPISVTNAPIMRRSLC